MFKVFGSFLWVTLCAQIFAQSFQVTGGSPSNPVIVMGKTTTVTLTVLGSGVSGLSLLPELRVSSSASESVTSLFTTVWDGRDEITDWSNGTSRDITFHITNYGTDGLCGADISFDLYFNTGSGVIMATTTEFLSFTNMGIIDLNIVDTISGVNLGESNFLLVNTGSSTPGFDPNVNVNSEYLEDENTRVYLYFDLDMSGRPYSLGFINLRYGISSGCTIVCEEMWGDINNHFIPGVIKEGGSAILSAPLGGGGGQNNILGNGINVFDVTDLSVAGNGCGTTVKETLRNPSVWLSWTVTGPIFLRDMRLVFGQASNECFVGESEFTQPLSGEFAISNVSFSSIGEVSATVTVPDAWRASSTTFASGFQAHWFLRKANEIVDLGVATNQLSMSALSGLPISDPTEWFLEVRIEKEVNGSSHWVSTTSDFVPFPFSTSLGTAVQNGSEIDLTNDGVSSEDRYLDSGEQVILPFTITGTPLTLDNLDFGYVIDSDESGTISSGDEVARANSVTSRSINFLLLEPSLNEMTFQVPYEFIGSGTDPKFWFFADFTTTSSGVTQHYRHYVDFDDLFLGVNFDSGMRHTVFDFTQGSQGWTVENNGSASGWQHSSQNQQWQGNPPQDATDASRDFALYSPEFTWDAEDPERAIRIALTHTPQFTTNESGGVWEYQRFSLSGVPGVWRDLVTDACNLIPEASGACTVYDDLTHPDDGSTLAGRPGWLGADLRNRTDVINLDVNFLQVLAPRIQFRFVYQNPTFDPKGANGTTEWGIQNVTYSTNYEGQDNFFGVDLTKLNYDGCKEPLALVFDAPSVDESQLTFEWFESLANVYTDTFTRGTANVPFRPATNDVTYYVRVSYTHPTSNNTVIRTYPINITNGTECIVTCLSETEILQRVWDDQTNWPASSDIRDYVALVNLECDE